MSYLSTIVIYNNLYCYCFVCVVCMCMSACLWAPVGVSMCRGQRLLSSVCLDHPSTYSLAGVTLFCSASVLHGCIRGVKIYQATCEHFLKPLLECYLIPSHQGNQWQFGETIGRSVGRRDSIVFYFQPSQVVIIPLSSDPHHTFWRNTGVLSKFYTCGKSASNFPFLSCSWVIIGSNAI